MEEKYSREKDRLGKVFGIAEELDNDLRLAVTEMKARDDWYVDHMQIFEDLNKAIKERYEMIERAVESERKSQHMSRAFTERVEEMVQARTEEMAEEEAEATQAEEATAAVEVVEEAPTPEDSPTVETEDAEEAPAPESEKTPPADWGDGQDPWAAE
jgi:type I site-specific restriction-modification system R (restriction) subunit